MDHSEADHETLLSVFFPPVLPYRKHGEEYKPDLGGRAESLFCTREKGPHIFMLVDKCTHGQEKMKKKLL